MTSRLVTIVLALGFYLSPCFSVRLDAGTGSVEDALGQIDESALTNLDISVVLVLPGFDDVRLPAAGHESQERFPTDYVLQLEPLPQAERQRSDTEDLPPGAQIYVSRLKPIFIAEGAPPELVWLAEVESGFDTLARSPIGAVGLFQLMPDTAKALGLTLAPWDQRRQPEKNGRAAAQYLKHLYETFGDWRLSVAAYNGGEGLVSRLLEKRAAHSYDEIAADLPAETQLYVPKVEATILRREGIALEKLKLPKTEQ
ncbi:MAG TPA: lytic transglycosylase domain-containing protein [Verrucomicrobiae bacterium]|nr:lytic transglycosylase domain-containing protein [Verrucomicrobiae bacterium]